MNSNHRVGLSFLGRGRAMRVILLAAIAVAGVLTACTSPLHRSQEQELRERLLSSHRLQLEPIAGSPPVMLSRPPSDVEQKLAKAGRVEELDMMSGPTAYTGLALQLGPDLTGDEKGSRVAITLQKAIELAVKNSYDVQVAELAPAANMTLVTQAEAVFDAVFFSNFDYSHLDTPGSPRDVILSGTVDGDVWSDRAALSTGIRKPLTSGGSIRAQTDFNYSLLIPPSVNWNPTFGTSVLVGLTQPILRNFGRDIATAPVQLAVNTQRASVQDLHNTLLDTALETETRFWDLVQARQQLLIQIRLLERTVEDRDRLEKREQFDVSPVRITEANSFVELRRADVIRARNQVRVASDRLKAIINSPEMPVSGEALLLPTDMPADLPLSFSLLDAVTTALQRRPDVRKSLLAIEDASTRQRVADNARLPQLDLSLALRYNGLSPDGVYQSYQVLDDGRYIDYLASIQFEMPIGNRKAEAGYEQRRIERRAAVIAYQRTVQLSIVSVKESLRNLLTAYELIGATRAARRAAADSLRAIEEQERAGVALTPEFLLDLKLATQQRVADAETQEIQALTTYNQAIAAFYRTTGTLLERNSIAFHEDEAKSKLVKRNVPNIEDVK
ncbi:MAG: TolC family protein [Phycisphaeraceae bacterium]|nr:TolC family protein [Phycisphaeraceae bacterium]